MDKYYKFKINIDNLGFKVSKFGMICKYTQKDASIYYFSNKNWIFCKKRYIKVRKRLKSVLFCHVRVEKYKPYTTWHKRFNIQKEKKIDRGFA